MDVARRGFRRLLVIGGVGLVVVAGAVAVPVASAPVAPGTDPVGATPSV